MTLAARLLRSQKWQLSPARFEVLATQQTSRLQNWISTSDDPFLNLSIEHFLLQKSPVDSFVLFQYINRPSVIIGRNQNPWHEANLQALRKPNGIVGANGQIDLVRRRSGGGTVFHDYGNCNWSVICPTDAFTRDTSAEMVVQALRPLNSRVKVNVRHDIVLDQGDLDEHADVDAHDMHATKYTANAEGKPSLKVSGSAYKLTRGRALHHATCLVNSKNIANISRLLRAPGGQFISAKGVDSVRSPVANVLDGQDDEPVNQFQDMVQRSFLERHNADPKPLDAQDVSEHRSDGYNSNGLVMGFVGDDSATLPAVQKGLSELRSNEWLYGQTPSFTLSTSSLLEDQGPFTESPSIREYLGSNNIEMEVKHGIIERCVLSGLNEGQSEDFETVDATLRGRKLWELDDFGPAMAQSGLDKAAEVSRWLNRIFDLKAHHS